MLHRVIISAVVAMMAGCSAGMSPGVPDGIRVSSVPDGASVVVMGRHLGTTPLTVPVKAIFPTVYPAGEEELYGRILLQKTGCADHVTTVDGRVLRHGLQVKLECPSDRVTVDAAPSPVQSTPLSPGDRLRQLEDIHRNGLISDDEYRQLRRHILDAL